MSSRRDVTGALDAPSQLLPRCFPATATRYACRSSIPLSRPRVAIELAVRIGAIDRDLDEALASNVAGDVRARPGNLTVGHGQGGACRWFATSAVGDDGDLPQPVIGRLGQSGSCGSGEKGGNSYRANAIAAH